MTGPIDMNGQKITGLPDPAADTEAAHKAYVDEQVSAANEAAAAAKEEAAACLPLAGGTMVGTIYTNIPGGTHALSMTNPTSGVQMNIGIGSGNYNRGIFIPDTNGWMIYADSSNYTNLRGPKIRFIATDVSTSPFNLYYEAGYTADTKFWQGAGFITNANKQVCFTIPLAKPIIGSPTITVTGGLKVRQGGYFFGCDASTYVEPSSWSVTNRYDSITVSANYDADSSTTNNAACGIAWSGTIVFS